MGTRADFYVGRGVEAEWLGSIAWDGYPAGVDDAVHLSDNEEEYRRNVAAFLTREDATLPEYGWPWPWDDSATTDYAYAFDAGRVYASSSGHEWFAVDTLAENYGEPDDRGGKVASFPDMKERKNVTLGKRSGVIVFGVGGES
jgi:hypothetical protein